MLPPPFQQTRLGKFVNEIRRRIVDENLAKRMKKLIKQWQALLQAATTPNGLPGVVVGVGGVAGVGASSSLPSVAPPMKRVDPAANRIRALQQRLSNLKTASHVSPPHAQAAVPNELHHLPQALPDSQAVSSSSSLPNSYAPSSALPQQPHTATLAAVNSNKSPPPAPSMSLMVKIPRNNVRLSKGNSVTDMHRSASAAALAGLGSSKFPKLQQTGVEDDSAAKVLHLVVSIDTSVLPRSTTLPPQTGESIKAEASPEAQDPLSKAPSSHFYPAMKRTEMMASDSERTSESPMEVDRPSSSSSSSSSTEGSLVPGMHGCIGPDGLWYEWTAAIPGQEPCVTMLPYVYVDGWDAMDQS